MKVVKLSRKDLAKALALLLAGGSGVVGCSSPAKTGLSDVALARAVAGDHKVASAFANCATQYDQIACQKRVLGLE